MTQDVTLLDIGSAIPYLVDSFKKITGKDAVSEHHKLMLENLYRVACETSSHVQCIGMSKPIPIDKIYQNTKLADSSYNDYKSKDLLEIVCENKSFVVFAGPGDGKTTLMHWLFNNLIKSKKFLPILITLRWDDAIKNLIDVVSSIEKGRNISKDNKKIVLIVDGYDEVSLENRKLVSSLLMKFNSLKVGMFCLTCRSHYDVIDLAVQHYWVSKFNKRNSIDFCNKFFVAYEVKVDAVIMIRKLFELGLGSFTEHPLMLTLVCLIHTSVKRTIPKNTIRLIAEATRTLTYKWDEYKGIDRQSKTKLDGEERIRCLSLIAYKMINLVGDEQNIHKNIKEYLYRQQIQKVDTDVLLDELVQWFGILVPVSVGQWGFVHRTIHDYLAAKYWVECGEFALDSVDKWDTRTAYAMCIMPDATQFIKKALRSNCEINVFAQCLVNNAAFNSNIIAIEFNNYLNNKDVIECRITKHGATAEIKTSHDIFCYASEVFLEDLILSQEVNRLEVNAVAIIVFCLYEYTIRKLPIRKHVHTFVDKFLTKKAPKYHIAKGVRIIELKLNELITE